MSMATFAARRLLEMADNTAGIVAIELLAASQGVEFRQPLVSSAGVMRVLGTIRAVVPRFERDHPFTPDIVAVKALVESDVFQLCVPEVLVGITKE